MTLNGLRRQLDQSLAAWQIIQSFCQCCTKAVQIAMPGLDSSFRCLVSWPIVGIDTNEDASLREKIVIYFANPCFLAQWAFLRLVFALHAEHQYHDADGG